jgi:hypothetical protein
MAGALPILDGRRFGCTRCGACCMEPGFVYIDEEELAKIGAHLELERDALIARYKIDREGKRFVIDASDGSGCPLLTSGKECSVQRVKPKQCSTFPFWPEMIDDAAEWEHAKSFCPGMDSAQGKIYSRGEILAIRAGWMGT